VTSSCLPTRIVYGFLTAPCVLHISPIPFSFILSLQNTLANSTNYEAPLYMIFSTPCYVVTLGSKYCSQIFSIDALHSLQAKFRTNCDASIHVVRERVMSVMEVRDDNNNNNNNNNNNFNLYLNRSIPTDRTIPVNRPDTTFINKKTKNTFLIVIDISQIHITSPKQ